MRWVAMIGVVLLAAGVAFAAEFEMSKRAGDYTVQIKIDRNPPSVGSNILNVFITDQAGNPVQDAGLAVDYGTGRKRHGAALLKHDLGWYHAELDLTRKGRWFVNVAITQQEKTASATFTFDVK